MIDLESLYFNVVELHSGDVKRPYFIVSVKENQKRFINNDGEIEKENTVEIEAIDLTNTFLMGEVIVEKFDITDQEKFLANAKIGNAIEYSDQLLVLCQMIAEELIDLNELGKTYNRTISSVKRLLNNAIASDTDNGRIAFNGHEGILALLGFNMIKGGDVEIHQSEVQKIGSVIMGHIEKNVGRDFSAEEDVESLRREIELDIIKALPNKIKAQNLHLDMKKIVEEIENFKKLKNPNDNDNNEDDFFNESDS